MKNIIGLIVGLLFGFGLAASGMTNTQKVLGFLDIFGAWDPDLLFVMGAAVLTTVIGYKLVLKKGKPFLANDFFLPLNTRLDRPLLVGASLFGIGWGLYGYCPGPAIASIAYLEPVTMYFLLSMLVGMVIGKKSVLALNK